MTRNFSRNSNQKQNVTAKGAENGIAHYYSTKTNWKTVNPAAHRSLNNRDIVARKSPFAMAYRIIPNTFSSVIITMLKLKRTIQKRKLKTQKKREKKIDLFIKLCTRSIPCHIHRTPTFHDTSTSTYEQMTDTSILRTQRERKHSSSPPPELRIDHSETDCTQLWLN